MGTSLSSTCHWTPIRQWNEMKDLRLPTLLTPIILSCSYCQEGHKTKMMYWHWSNGAQKECRYVSMTATVLKGHQTFNRLAEESMIAEHVAGESMIPNHDNGCCLQPSPMNRWLHLSLKTDASMIVAHVIRWIYDCSWRYSMNPWLQVVLIDESTIVANAIWWTHAWFQLMFTDESMTEWYMSTMCRQLTDTKLWACLFFLFLITQTLHALGIGDNRGFIGGFLTFTDESTIVANAVWWIHAWFQLRFNDESKTETHVHWRIHDCNSP